MIYARRFVFHHIPKSGGTSVKQAVEASGALCCWVNDRAESLEGALARGAQWYASHFLFRDYMPAAGDVYFTWIRDPVELFFSGYYYWRDPRIEVLGFEFDAPMVEFMRRVGRYEDARAYVDAVLEERPKHVFPRGLFNLAWDRFDFIGRTDRMAESLEAFNRRFGTRLEHVHVNRKGRGDVIYRRAELEEFLAPELEAFRRFTRGNADAGRSKSRRRF